VFISPVAVVFQVATILKQFSGLNIKRIVSICCLETVPGFIFGTKTRSRRWRKCQEFLRHVRDVFVKAEVSGWWQYDNCRWEHRLWFFRL